MNYPAVDEIRAMFDHDENSTMWKAIRALLQRVDELEKALELLVPFAEENPQVAREIGVVAALEKAGWTYTESD